MEEEKKTEVGPEKRKKKTAKRKAKGKVSEKTDPEVEMEVRDEGEKDAIIAGLQLEVKQRREAAAASQTLVLKVGDSYGRPTAAPLNTAALRRLLAKLTVLPDAHSLTMLEPNCTRPIAQYPEVGWSYGTVTWMKIMKRNCVSLLGRWSLYLQMTMRRSSARPRLE
jgi:hypothetical protein